MTPDQAIAAADRAAQAAGNFGGKRGWLDEIGAAGRLGEAVAFVRGNRDAPAEALYLTVRREPVAWADLRPQKRVAVEVFRATLCACDMLVPAAAPVVAPAARGHLVEPAIERGAGFGERETW